MKNKVKFYPLAIVSGFAVEYIGSFACIISFMFVRIRSLILRGYSDEMITTYFKTNFLWALFIFYVGTLFLLLGGWTTGTISKKSKIANAALFGVLDLSLFLVTSVESTIHAWYNPLAIIFTVPVAILGGYLSTRIPFESIKFCKYFSHHRSKK
jgi:hypothetical protein